jgi:hypothetical protein
LTPKLISSSRWTTSATGCLPDTNVTFPAGWGVLAPNGSVLSTHGTVTRALGGAARFCRLHKP